MKVCKDQNVSVIAVEPQYPSNTSAKTLLEEIKRKGLEHARHVIVDPLETAGPEELQDPGFYEQKMRQNLKNLAEALP
jgi:ABC-type Zn uptake system ZnuABC Zn-binding protein ZnuA